MRCSACQNWLPAEEFAAYVLKAGRGYCRECRRAYDEKYRATHQDQIRRYREDRREQRNIQARKLEQSYRQKSVQDILQEIEAIQGRGEPVPIKMFNRLRLAMQRHDGGHNAPSVDARGAPSAGPAGAEGETKTLPAV
jgi:hypothetical protein